ncbi:MAG: S41 family peptidase [Clostridia bacterium]|nr:S41 family peptidase [Clostridia bacterium]
MAKSSVVKKVAVRAGIAVAVLCVVVASFFCGYFVRGSVSDSGNDSIGWLLSMIDTYYYQDVPTEDFYDYSIDSFISKYLDSYSAYYTAEEYKQLEESNSGSKSGYGISYSYIPSRGVLANTVVFNSPAYISGLRSGDYIVSATFGGETYEFTSQADFTSYVSDRETGEEVTFNTLGGQSYTFAKSSYTASYVVCATAQSSWAFLSEDGSTPVLYETGTDAIDYLPEGAGYICLSQFYGEAASQFAQAVAVLNSQGCTSLILDLRNNGGGYVSVMQYIASCFTSSISSSEVCAMTAEYKSGSVTSFYTDSKYSSGEGCTVDSGTHVYVLANGNTASASEALIGVLISYGIIDYGDIYVSDYSSEYLTLTGYSAEDVKSCRTYGKGIMQTTYKNDTTGEAIKLTTAQIYWPNGTTIHGTGVTAADGVNLVQSPYPSNGDGEELKDAVTQIFG